MTIIVIMTIVMKINNENSNDNIIRIIMKMK